MGFTERYVSRFFSPSKKKLTERQNWAYPEELCRRFSLAEIRAATQCFDQSLLIGRGGFGSVYKGYINDGATVVAIKQISEHSNQGIRGFRAEVQLLCQLRHPNLISLIGFCEEKGKCILVYNYLPNGTLSASLFRRTEEHDMLSWKQRLNICIGVARALHYFHAGVKNAVIHRDVKCSIILLDERLEAKLSGLGISKMGPPTISNTLIRVESRVMGTVGYLDPEYIVSGKLTEKSDVYSFGMVLLEVLCAKYCNGEQRTIINGGETLPNSMDPFLIGKIAPDSLRKFIGILQRCIRSTGAERPTMGEVQVELEFALELQETADTSLAPPVYDYTFQGISFSEINHTLLEKFGPWLDKSGSVDLDSSGSVDLDSNGSVDLHPNS